jgi:hypothetical protein
VGCEPIEGEEECFGRYCNIVDDHLSGDAGAPMGMVIAIERHDDLKGTTSVSGTVAELWLINEDVDGDGVVAVYVSEVQPDRSALPEPSAEISPPAEIDGLGQLVAAYNLARFAAATPDAEIVYV